jgi:hypothetical protein
MHATRRYVLRRKDGLPLARWTPADQSEWRQLVQGTQLDAFTRAYVHAAAFTQDPESGQGEYPEPAIEDIDTTFLAQAIFDCDRFQAEHAIDIAEDSAHAGRDFWYTRNGHGCGFWDGDWPEPAGEQLTDAAHRYGEVYAQVFADGRDQFDAFDE